MKVLTAPLVAVSLIAAGALGNHAFAGNQSAAVTAAVTTTTTSTSADTAAVRAFAAAGPSVVYVKSTGVGSGSGVIYDSGGDIVTNAHVVSGAKSITVTLSTGKTYTATLLGTDTADDLAVLHISATGLPAAHFAAAGTYKVAQTVLAIGSPLGLQGSVTSGLISALNRTVQEETGAYLPSAIQTSAAINPGNSGGALVALDGTVVGIPTLQATDSQNNSGGAAQGIGFAIPSERVTYVASQIISTGSVQHTGRAYLGLNATDSSSQSTSSYYGFGSAATTSVTGALVQSVASASPADKAGIQQGDVITAFNGKTIEGEDDLLTALAQQKPGATVTITFEQNGSSQTVHIQLGELSAS